MHFVGTAVNVRALHVMPDVEVPASELHAHDYRIEVVVERERLDDRGMVCDLDMPDAALAATADSVRDKDRGDPAVGQDRGDRRGVRTLGIRPARRHGRRAADRPGLGVAGGLRRLPGSDQRLVDGEAAPGARIPGEPFDGACAGRLPQPARGGWVAEDERQSGPQVGHITGLD